MKEVLLLSSLFTWLASVLAIIIGGYGIYSAITGRCTLCGDRIKGRAARIAGLFMMLPLVLGIVTWPIFRPEYGIYREATRIAMPLLAFASLLVGLFMALRQRSKAVTHA